MPPARYLLLSYGWTAFILFKDIFEVMSHLGHGAAPKISRMIQYISVWYRYCSIMLIPQTAFEMKFKYLTSRVWYSSKQQPHTALSGTVMVCSGAALFKLQSLDADVSLFTKAFTDTYKEWLHGTYFQAIHTKIVWLVLIVFDQCQNTSALLIPATSIPSRCLISQVHLHNRCG